MRPESVNILGVTYKISYVDKPPDVDIFKRASLWGQIDYWTRTIRVYDDGTQPPEDTWRMLFHEILHGIAHQLHLKVLEDEDNHDLLDVLALALTDVLFRNDWIKGGGK